MTFHKLGEDFRNIIIPLMLDKEYNININELYTSKVLSRLKNHFLVISTYAATYPKIINKDLASVHCGLTWWSIIYTYLHVLTNDKIFVGSGDTFIINTDKVHLDFTKKLLNIIENFEYSNEQIINYLNHLYVEINPFDNITESECKYIHDLMDLLHKPGFDGIVGNKKRTKTILL